MKRYFDQAILHACLKDIRLQVAVFLICISSFSIIAEIAGPSIAYADSEQNYRFYLPIIDAGPDHSTPPQDETPINTNLEDEGSSTQEEIDSEEAMSRLVAGNSDFAFDLYRELLSGEGEIDNLIYSPYSISSALAMVYAGAKGETEAEMAETMYYTLSQELLHPTFKALDLDLMPSEEEEAASDEDFKLSIANALWKQFDHEFLTEYLDTIAENYRSEVQSVDFKDPEQREVSRETINSWVEESTEGKIKDLVPPSVLDELTRLVLTNAIYFNAKWQEPFDPEDTSDQPFALLDGSTIAVPTMLRETETQYAKNEQYELLDIPYKGQHMSMSILVPAEGEFGTVEQLLDRQFMDQALGELAIQNIELYLPKFQYETDLKLSDQLKSMGMPDLFTEKISDLSGMDGVGIPESLYVNGVIHKAFIGVGEKGTEAAAATGVIFPVPTSLPPPAITVRVDRPFIYFIRDSESGTILFMGRVVDPSTGQIDPPTTDEGSGNLGSDEQTDEPVDMSPEEEMAALVTANSNFAFDLYRAIDSEGKNLFYSPYSISAALAMTYVGARENTETQMAEVSHYPLSQERLHPTFKALDLSLNSAGEVGEDTDEDIDENFKLSIANSLWGQVGYPFLPEYVAAIAENYGAGVQEVDFVDEEQREFSRQTINNWVEESTEGKIKELLKKGILTIDTRLALINAIYFKAEWEKPFLNGTEPRDFTLLDESQISVPTMSRRWSTKYAQNEQYELLEIPYKGQRMSMVILMPLSGEFEAVEQSLTGESVTAALDTLAIRDTKLYVPKFQYESDLTLNQILIDMGMPDLFTPGLADLSGIDGMLNLFMAHMIHKGRIPEKTELVDSVEFTPYILT